MDNTIHKTKKSLGLCSTYLRNTVVYMSGPYLSYWLDFTEKVVENNLYKIVGKPYLTNLCLLSLYIM